MSDLLFYTSECWVLLTAPWFNRELPRLSPVEKNLNGDCQVIIRKSGHGKIKLPNSRMSETTLYFYSGCHERKKKKTLPPCTNIWMIDCCLDSKKTNIINTQNELEIKYITDTRRCFSYLTSYLVVFLECEKTIVIFMYNCIRILDKIKLITLRLTALLRNE